VRRASDACPSRVSVAQASRVEVGKAHALALKALIHQVGDVHVSTRGEANYWVTVGPDTPVSSLNVLDDDASEKEADLVSQPVTNRWIHGPLVQGTFQCR
jgi:hypothetical protein